MIPLFPEFKPVEIGDREEIESLTRRFPTYSDFNFVSLLSWGQSQVSILNGNLAICLQDYMTGAPVYSFMGTNDVAGTSFALLDLAAEQSSSPVLKLIPQFVVEASDAEFDRRFIVAEDADSSDYVMSVGHIATLDLPELRRIERQVAKFTASHPKHRTERLDLGDQGTARAIDALCRDWQGLKNHSEEDVQAEFAAIRRCVSFGDRLGIAALGLFVEGQLAGFMLNEVLPDRHAVWHFGKAHPALPGADKLLHVHNARMLRERGCAYVNYEQDLGLPGLRQSKRSWLPAFYLKKFTVIPKP